MPSTYDVVYFLTLVDDVSRAIWVYLLRDKKEVLRFFIAFLIMVVKQFDVSVKTVRNDNGIEFRCMFPYFENKGIVFQTSCVETPQQNGRVERKHRHILNVARAPMFQANIPIFCRGSASSRRCMLLTIPPLEFWVERLRTRYSPVRYQTSLTCGCLGVWGLQSI